MNKLEFISQYIKNKIPDITEWRLNTLLYLTHAWSTALDDKLFFTEVLRYEDGLIKFEDWNKESTKYNYIPKQDSELIDIIIKKYNRIDDTKLRLILESDEPIKLIQSRYTNIISNWDISRFYGNFITEPTEEVIIKLSEKDFNEFVKLCEVENPVTCEFELCINRHIFMALI